MKLPWQKSENPSSTDVNSPTSAEQSSAESEQRPKGYTPPKGRPTPKRREVEIERGVIRDPSTPRSPAQRNAQRKELKKSMSKEEWKAYKAKEREESRKHQRDMQAAMDRGDERYLMARDRGEERRFVRDWIDSRRFLNNYVMPVAIGLLVILFVGTWLPQFANIMSMFAMVLMVFFFIEGIWLGSKVNRAVRAKFPGTSAAGLGLGFYAYSRATQPRKWRTPKPRLSVGDQP
ncbi:DUF3043 domain-containing protein [Corynebacterium atrinae]|uniref:DUF3043 domain-containing protein n=1 Tax=Corynebacterium atrinae TaxID=1336740 RepID=UPI0025B4FB81|nr:DUF3043 domain-containing protein [Corynebacterium atrinae]